MEKNPRKFLWRKMNIGYWGKSILYSMKGSWHLNYVCYKKKRLSKYLTKWVLSLQKLIFKQHVSSELPLMHLGR